MYPLPTAGHLETIRTWKMEKFPQLVEFIREIWIYDSIFTSVKTEGIEYEFVTCNIPGNMDIIKALQENRPIWDSMWIISNSKGIHKFFVPYSWIKEND
jgi:hypothetical protein